MHINTRRAFLLLASLILGLSLTARPSHAIVGAVSTWLGKTYAGDGGDATKANLDAPRGFAASSSCSLLIADTNNHVIRRIDGTTNVITTYAGSGQNGLTNGTTRQASFRQPSDIAYGPGGDVFVTEGDSTVVRKISHGIVSTWLTGLKRPAGIAISGTTIYISDTGNNRILTATTTNPHLSVLASGIPTPGKLAISGNDLYVVYNASTSFGKVDATTGALTAIQTGLANAEGLTIHTGLVYVITGVHGVINEIHTYNISSGAWLLLKSMSETEGYNHASDITFCGSSMRLLFSGGSSVYRLNEDGTNETKIAGVHRWNDADGTKKTALVGRPWLLTMSPNRRHLYVMVNEQLKDVNLGDTTLHYMAGAPQDNYVDGVARISRVSGPTQMVISPDGSKLYIADRNNERLRIFNIKTKVMSTLTGAGTFNAFGGISNAYAEGGPCNVTTTGAAGCAYFDRPMGLAINASGKTLYVADSDNNRIRSVNIATGQTALLAGTGTKGLKNGPAKTARFNHPSSLLLSADGKLLYIVEAANNDVRVLNLTTKQVTTLVGTGKPGYLDGKFSNARLNIPNFLALGPNNTLFLSEAGTLRIRRLNLTTKQVTTLAGSGQSGNQNGLSGNASFSNPRGMVMLNSSTLLVADEKNDEIRAVSLK